ncbi:hypothetical protein O9929_14280 [Vibrio lentus]|nr:hypothetical protein [Vibrio lentus]
MRVDFIGDLRKFNLEYGEADIAIRRWWRETYDARQYRVPNRQCGDGVVRAIKAILSSMDYRKTITGSSIVLSP